MRLLTNSLLASLLISILSLSCQKEVKDDSLNPGSGGGTGTTINPTPVTGNVTGKVVDNNGIAVAGAIVRSGNKSTVTDSRGLFRFDNIQLDKYASLVTAEKTGFFKAYRVFSASASNTSFVKLKLVQKTLIGNVDAAAGGSVNLPDNSKIILPASGVVIKSNNQNYTGSVKIYAAVIDPTSTDIAQIVPGGFQGIDANNYRVILKSFGMLAVELEGNSGEQLQIAAGKTARLRFTIPALLRSSAPATIPLWSVDETTGLWKQEGNATKGSDYYEGDVSHFSFWNCDVSSQTVFLELTVATADGSLPYTHVRITRANGGGSSYGFTDSTGHVGGLVPKNEPLLLEILNNCYQPVYSQNIGPFSSNTNLGAITIIPQPLTSLTVTGNAVNCSNQSVTNGNALIYFDGLYYNTPIINGSFSITVTRCSATTPIEVLAIDNAGLQQSNIWTGSASSGTVNTGILAACGSSSISYIDYVIDGSNYSLNTANPGDSISTFGYTGSTQTSTYVFGFRVSQPNMYINFHTNNAGVGTFPLTYLNINQYDSLTTLVAPFNVTFTSYGAPGEFIEGNFSGQIRETSTNNLHNVSATFRVRRN
ncbi:MAG TPA: carboxypeptidase-like regulatory domain-containing protein [Chitinophagaceae bacterium]|nr:carboxypeptidase-like regulatory domain-containing protein [Chitinophagaceae bacterium]